jgi:dienelactone hydrolase
VFTYPPDFTPSKKYPLVLYVHGGPNSASKETLNPFVQYMAAQGWVVFEPNYRGSDNMGNQFFSSIYKDAGDGPGRDVMAGVAMLEARGFIDTGKLAVSGWSYGGYMTTWLLGHYDVWKAAVAGASVTDWVTMYTTADGSVTIGDQVGGSPYVGGNMQSYRDQSPMSFAQNTHAPTLILHDTGDTRVPIADSYEFFRALKDNGVTTQFIAYPISGHSPADPIRKRWVASRSVPWDRCAATHPPLARRRTSVPIHFAGWETSAPAQNLARVLCMGTSALGTTVPHPAFTSAPAQNLRAPSISRSWRNGWETSAPAQNLRAPSISRSLRNGRETSAPAQNLRAPSISRSWRNGWETSALAQNLHAPSISRSL